MLSFCLRNIDEVLGFILKSLAISVFVFFFALLRRI